MVQGGQSTFSSNPKFIDTLTDNSLTTNLKLCLDAGDENSYTSGQSWLDLSGGGYDFFLGATGSAEATDPTFNGSAGGLTSAEYFSIVSEPEYLTYDSALETWMNNLHKNSANFSMCFWLWPTSNHDAGNQQPFDTSGNGNKTGTFLYFADNDQLRLFIKNGSSTVFTVRADDINMTFDEWHFIGLRIDEASNTGFMYIDGDYWQVSSSNTFACTYSSPSTGAADGPPKLLSTEDVDGGAYFYDGTRFAGVVIHEGGGLSKANMDTLYAATSPRFAV